MAGFRSKPEQAEQDGSDVMTAPVPVQVAAPSAAFPRVNLLPDEIAEQAKVRRAKIVLVGAIAVSAVLIGGLYVMANNDVASAQEGLDAAQVTSTQLNAQAAALANVPAKYAQVAAAQADVVTAMGTEVRWSYQLNNLALMTPSGVSIVTYKGTLAAAASGSTTTTTTNTTAPAGIGTIAFTGEAKSYSKVSEWLDSLAKQPSYVNPYPSLVALSTDSTNPGTVAFTNTVTLGNKALSHRFDSQAGN